MKIEITKKEQLSIENAWKLVRNKISGGTNEENKYLEQNLYNILDGLRTLINKTKYDDNLILNNLREISSKNYGNDGVGLSNDELNNLL